MSSFKQLVQRRKCVFFLYKTKLHFINKQIELAKMMKENMAMKAEFAKHNARIEELNQQQKRKRIKN
jgi:hypothetical protein